MRYVSFQPAKFFSSFQKLLATSIQILNIWWSIFRRACGHVDVGTCPHQVLAATLTLSQPGGQIMPTLYWRPHQVLKATGVPAPNLIVVLI